ncbi:30S ribosome-binding factor RbfA [Helicobacter aurati]|uniref:30S ribosome-binding factor RbfA n=1 Tax=Helicobacter aurati TaxID=137778 RepID=A0A3D8J778_9HELI|nr:30S ribosome-binding factor RbfA [Helicobacter aurati]RDU73339.1 30S ribosome-binding factor RbfA [Helicobacter aurati]
MQNQITQQKKEAFLKEILTEIFSELHNELLNTLEIVNVQCSRGKYNAKIFVESSLLTDTQRQEIQKAFKRAKPFIQSNVLRISKWYNAPKLMLCFDSSLQHQNRLDVLFSQISNERKTKVKHDI